MIDHPKCKACAHFSASSDEWDRPHGFGVCNLVEMTYEMTAWDEDYENLTLKPEYKEHLAGVMDGSSYSATLHPHPDFYCPMHSDLMPELESTND
ncbi:MAG: hypothetical protein GOVbin4685_42 [Prokaryotic dsDNA virus sp.]|jgi:hypothetical protein|nr:MAG: hypothetical protein GOVbin4685_42 [Prokaryotic dsDNA virus sp.]|tara:strand:+ start:4128 stop:4412 length:285 start_codon:yes stop_codon:yes gene_type:complete